MLDWNWIDQEVNRDLLIIKLGEGRGWYGGCSVDEQGVIHGGLIHDAYRAYHAWKDEIRKVNVLRERKNAISAEVGRAKREKKEELAQELMQESVRVGQDLAAAEGGIRFWEEATRNLWLCVPNIPDEMVPKGTDETANVVIHFPEDANRLPEQPVFDFAPKDHVELGTAMGCMDFEQTAKISGTRFVTLRGPLAKLERVLANWMLDFAVALGFEEAAPPSLVNAEAMLGTGQLPKFEEDLFKTTDGRYLIPTAEVSLTNIARDRIFQLEEAQMIPNIAGNDEKFIKLSDGEVAWNMSFIALTPCYRGEAGSAGRDTRGMMRMHEFKKVEMVVLCHPSVSGHNLLGMVDTSREMLIQLGLNHRCMLLCGGDMGFSARRTYDLEVWLPSEERYREIASISDCGDFQARRMNARYKIKGTKGTDFVHTLNGSALAVGRTLLAVMENFQTEQGGITIPQVLRDRMGGSLITPEGTVV